MQNAEREKTALITGGSSGIGFELAKVFAEQGFGLVLVARDKKKLLKAKQELEEGFNARVKIILADLAKPSAVQEIFHKVKKESIKIDVLVNNAGFGVFGPFSSTDLDKELEMLQVNIVALTHLTKLFLPQMLENRGGKILNVASTAAFQPGPLMAVYYASKAYALHFSEAIANELEGSGVTVTALCPGPTRSNFQKEAQMQESKLLSGRLMDAKIVAREGFKGLMKGKKIVIPGFKNNFLAFLVRLFPRSTVAATVRALQEKNR